jgi:hypothetical protein
VDLGGDAAVNDLHDAIAAAQARATLTKRIGGLCRCLPCCCKDGEGHNHPAWKLYEAEERAHGRYQDALEFGLSDHEAREEGWPTS